MNKHCRWCDKDKPIDDFPLHRRMADGHLNKCRDCVLEYERVRRATDPKVQESERQRYRDGKRKASILRYRIANPGRDAVSKWASQIVRRAVKRGDIQKATACERCLRSGVALEGAHADYSQPLKVEWLCRTCHRRWDCAIPKTA